MTIAIAKSAEQIEQDIRSLLGLGHVAGQPTKVGAAAVAAAASAVPATASPRSPAAGVKTVAVAPLSFSDFLELLTAGGIDASFQPVVLTDSASVAASSSTTLTATVPTGSVLVAYDLAFFVSQTNSDFLVTLATDNNTLFSDMVMNLLTSPPLKGAFLRPVKNEIAWTLVNNSQSQTALTYWLQGAYIDQATWYNQIVPALKANAAIALALGSVGGSGAP